VDKPVGLAVTVVSAAAAAAFSETVLQQTELAHLLVRAILLAVARMRMVVSVVPHKRVALVDSVDSELLAVAWVTMAAAAAVATPVVRAVSTGTAQMHVLAAAAADRMQREH
jgi:hypothetical protein